MPLFSIPPLVSGRLLLTLGGIFLFWPACPAFSSPAVEKTDALSDIQRDLISKLPDMQRTLVGMDFGEAGFGSGIIVSKEGIILSAAHVTGGVRRPFTVILPGGKRVKAITKGLDAARDAAMAQITESGEYPFTPLAETPPRQGDWVFALGHPGGYDKSRGSVVRLGKVVSMDDSKIQTDCKLIGGDSGGPLFNKEGKLIGIHSRVGQGLEDNLHVPAPLFQKEWDQLSGFQWIEDGPFAPREQGFLNREVQETPNGIKIVPLSQSAANTGKTEKDAFPSGGLLISWNGQKIVTLKDLEVCLKKSYPGQQVTAVLKTDSGDQTFTPILGIKPRHVPPPSDKAFKRI